MHTVVETPTYLSQAKRAGVSADELDAIAEYIAANPSCGDLIPGTGGARKVRFAPSGRGKRGGYRVIHFFAADDVPIFLLALVAKGQRADLTQQERTTFARSWAAWPMIIEGPYAKYDDTEETLMSTFGKELIQSAKEARAFARSETDEKTFGVRVPQEVDVRALRAKLDMTQAAFADRFGFDISAVRDWEQNRRRPDRSARVLLTVIDHSPDVVEAALRSALSSSDRRKSAGTRTARAGRSAGKAPRPAGRAAKARA